MPHAPADQSEAAIEPRPGPSSLVAMLKAHYESIRQVRRGVCLLGAGQFDQASAAFSQAMERGVADKSLPSYLAACLLAQGDTEGAAAQFEQIADEDEEQTTAQIREALARWSAGHGDQAIVALRKRIEANPECAELHFQLGTILCMPERYEEAELRFTQVLSLDRDHTEAMVSLAMCYGLRGAVAEAVGLLQRAQALKPFDARIGLLLGQAAAAMQQQGQVPRIRAHMPDATAVDDTQGIQRLSRVIETEPDIVDAFLSLPSNDIHTHVFEVLILALEAIIERQPTSVEVYVHKGRVQERLGCEDDAIRALQRALEIDPKHARALIELGRMYVQADRPAQATAVLEQAVATGANYADVHCLLGNLYCRQGEVIRARTAYRSALVINEHYEAARIALESLPA